MLEPGHEGDFDPKSLTVAKLKTFLSDEGVQFPSHLKKADLVKLAEEKLHEIDSKADPDLIEAETSTSSTQGPKKLVKSRKSSSKKTSLDDKPGSKSKISKKLGKKSTKTAKIEKFIHENQELDGELDKETETIVLKDQDLDEEPDLSQSKDEIPRIEIKNSPNLKTSNNLSVERLPKSLNGSKSSILPKKRSKNDSNTPRKTAKVLSPTDYGHLFDGSSSEDDIFEKVVISPRKALTPARKATPKIVKTKISKTPEIKLESKSPLSSLKKPRSISKVLETPLKYSTEQNITDLANELGINIQGRPFSPQTEIKIDENIEKTPKNSPKNNTFIDGGHVKRRKASRSISSRSRDVSSSNIKLERETDMDNVDNRDVKSGKAEQMKEDTGKEEREENNTGKGEKDDDEEEVEEEKEEEKEEEEDDDDDDEEDPLSILEDSMKVELQYYNSPSRKTKIARFIAKFVLYFTLWTLAFGLCLFGWWYREQVFLIGYCGQEINRETLPHGSAPVWITELGSYLDTFKPQCIPCPPHGRCLPMLELHCYNDFMVSKPWYSDIIPVNLHHKKCVPDTKKAEKLEIMIEVALDLLRSKNANENCGRNSENDFSSGFPVNELHDLLLNMKASYITTEEFEELWERSLIELEKEPEIIVGRGPNFSAQANITNSEGESSKTNKIFRSTSLSHISFQCQLQNSIIETIIGMKYEIFVIFLAIVVVQYSKYLITQRRLKGKQVSVITAEVFRKLIEQRRLAASNESIPQYIGSTQLRDLILTETNLNTKIELWKKVSHRVERNSNVRSRLEEHYGEIMKVWEWITDVE